MISQNTMVHVGSPETKTATGGKSHLAMDVVYKDSNGQSRSKTLRDFANPALFKAIQGLNEGDTFYVEVEKNAKGYWEWLKVSTEPLEKPAAAGGGGNTRPATKSTGTYETPQERGRKQVFIIRQSSFDRAASMTPEDASFSKVASLAEKIEAWIMRGWKLNDDDTISRVETNDEDVPQ